MSATDNRHKRKPLTPAEQALVLSMAEEFSCREIADAVHRSETFVSVFLRLARGQAKTRVPPTRKKPADRVLERDVIDICPRCNGKLNSLHFGFDWLGHMVQTCPTKRAA